MLALFLLAVGAVLVTVGAFLWCLPAGLVAAGLILGAVGYDITPDEPAS